MRRISPESLPSAFVSGSGRGFELAAPNDKTPNRTDLSSTMTDIQEISLDDLPALDQLAGADARS